MRDYKTAEQILDEASGSGSEFTERDLDAWFQRFQTNPTNTEPAFAALATIAAAVWSERGNNGEEANAPESVNPAQNVSVPFWIVQAIAGGWASFLGSRDHQTMEQAFGLQLQKPGTRSRLDTDATQLREMKIALEVGYCIGPGHERGSVQKALETVADHRGISVDAAKKAWQAHKDLVTERLALVRFKEDASR